MLIRSIHSALVVCLSLSGCVSAQDSEIGKILRRDVGTWDAEVKMFADLAAPPEVTKGVETNFLVGPYWLISHFKGKIMGADFEGSSQTGYDQASKKFVGTWVDSMSPHPMKMEGTWDEKTQTMTSTGTGKDPNGSEAKHKMVLVYNKDGSRNFTMFGYINGAEVKMMEIKYTRAASK